MTTGWISLHRRITSHWLWSDKPFSRGQAWIDLLIMANHQENKLLLGNELLEVDRGSFITSEAKLMDRWGWSNTKVRNFLTLLESDGMLTKETDRKKSTLTILNYGDYQDLESDKKVIKMCEKSDEKVIGQCEESDEKVIVNLDNVEIDGEKKSTLSIVGSNDYKDIESDKEVIGQCSESDKKVMEQCSESDEKVTKNTNNNENNVNNVNNYNNKHIVFFATYNKQGIVNHRTLTPVMKKAIDKALKQNSEENILEAITRYGQAFKDPAYKFCKYKMTLDKFLTQNNGYHDWLEEGQKWINYSDFKKGGGAKATTTPVQTKTKFHLANSRGDKYTADELEELILKNQKNRRAGG